MATRNYLNTTDPTSLSGALNNSATTFNVVSTAGFPSVPFIAGIDRGTVDEEVVLVTAKTSTTITATRGYDGTTGKAHLNGAAFEHCTAAIDAQEPNAHINNTALDHHTQYMNLARLGVYFPGTLNATSPTSISPITTTYKQANTLTIASAPFARKVQLYARVTSTLFDAAVRYYMNIRIGGSAVDGGAVESLGQAVTTMQVTSNWLPLAASTAYTYGTFVRRESGSGGDVEIGTSLNVLTALIVPA